MNILANHITQFQKIIDGCISQIHKNQQLINNIFDIFSLVGCKQNFAKNMGSLAKIKALSKIQLLNKTSSSSNNAQNFNQGNNKLINY